jgi:6,7-dimethyl-8-ribityllumazine synthase
VRVALIVSSYHDFITARLEAGARAELREAGVADADIVTFAVPGAFELAQAARRLAGPGHWAAVVCLGCLIKGETPHFDYIARATADGIMRAAQETGVPVTFGVLTTNTAEEAMARAGDGAGNKGREAARAALEMTRLYARLDANGADRPSGQS